MKFIMANKNKNNWIVCISGDSCSIEGIEALYRKLYYKPSKSLMKKIIIIWNIFGDIYILLLLLLECNNWME